MRTSTFTALASGPLLAALLLPLSALAGGDRFERADTNGDGYIDREEMSRMFENKFDKMDSDGDGRISREEHEQMRKDMKMKHHKGHMGEDDRMLEQRKGMERQQRSQGGTMNGRY